MQRIPLANGQASMSIDLYWDNEDQTVILAEFGKQWDWDELHAVLATIKRLSNEREQVFGAIIDIRQGLTVPGGSIFNREALNNFQKLMKLGDDGKGPVVLVGMNGMVKTIIDTVARMTPAAVQDVHFADNMEQGREVIYRLVAKLNATSA